MPDEIYVISEAIDGADLRRKKRENPHHIYNHGIDQPNMAKEHVGKALFAIPSERWEAIFGGEQ